MINRIGKQKNRGMTLIELMVVLSIFAIISSMVIFNYSDYKSSAAIKIISDDIALSIRQAQAYAIGVKSTDINGQASFPGYGVHFSTEDAVASGGNGASTYPACSDGLDNDKDGQIDINDPECHADGDVSSIFSYDPTWNDETLVFTYRGTQCSNKIDDDGDGTTDYDDPSCHTDGIASNIHSYMPDINDENYSTTPMGPACSDNFDNDADGFTDMNDNECHIDGNSSNTWSYDPTSNDESVSPNLTGAECQDKIDNDSDGLTDYDDSNCHTDGIPSNASSYDPNINNEGGTVISGNCNDSTDNDTDGSSDMADRSCHSDFNSSNPGSYDPNLNENRVAQCNDGLDNNFDSNVDMNDPNCHTDGNFKNSASYDPMWDDENTSDKTNWMQCINGIDDNFNGMGDYDEPNCHSDGNAKNSNSYNPNINDENDMNNIVFNFIPGNNFLKSIFNPVYKFITRAQKVFADSSIFTINGDNKSFITFADIPCSGQKGNFQYDYPSTRQATPCGRVISPTEIATCEPGMISVGAECISITNIVGADKISGFCINQECENFINGSSTSLRPGSLDFVFTRPNPDAAFCYSAPASISCTESIGISHAGVVLQSTSDARKKTIVVWSTGQISVY